MKRFCLPLPCLAALLAACTATPASAGHGCGPVSVGLSVPYYPQRVQLFSIPGPLAYGLGQAYPLQLPAPQAPVQLPGPVVKLEAPATPPAAAGYSAPGVVGSALVIDAPPAYNAYGVGFGLGVVDVRVEQHGVREQRRIDLHAAFRAAAKAARHGK